MPTDTVSIAQFVEANGIKMSSVWARESNGPAPNCARLIKEQNGNIRAALMALEMRLYAA